MVVYLEDNMYGGINYYRVMVDYLPYDSFISSTPLTWSQQSDIAAGYREALDGYTPPSVDSHS